MPADRHPIVSVQQGVGCNFQGAGFFMKKRLWIGSVVFGGSILLAQGLLTQGLLAQARAADSPAGAQSAIKSKTPDRAAAYYHFALAHMYEEQVANGRSELANKAIEEYRAAIDADPNSAYL